MLVIRLCILDKIHSCCFKRRINILPLSLSISTMSTLLAMMFAASVKADSMQYRPGSAIICTPLSSGKNSSSAPLMTSENQENKTQVKGIFHRHHTFVCVSNMYDPCNYTALMKTKWQRLMSPTIHTMLACLLEVQKLNN